MGWPLVGSGRNAAANAAFAELGGDAQILDQVAANPGARWVRIGSRENSTTFITDYVSE